MTCPSDTFVNILSETKVYTVSFACDVAIIHLWLICLQFSVRLGRALNPGEYRVSVYLLRVGEIEVKLAKLIYGLYS